MKFNVNVITRGDKVYGAFLDNKIAKEVMDRLNQQLEDKVEDVWLYYTIDIFEVNGFLKNTKNYISLLHRNNEPMYCYLNNIKKAENDYARLTKDGREDITYGIERFIKIEDNEVFGAVEQLNKYNREGELVG